MSFCEKNLEAHFILVNQIVSAIVSFYHVFCHWSGFLKKENPCSKSYTNDNNLFYVAEIQTHNVHCKAGSQHSENPTVQRGSMQV